MAETGDAPLRFSGRRMRLFSVIGDGENAVAGELELIFNGENVRGPHVSVNQALAVKKGDGLQGGSEDVAGFSRSERALGEKLREIFLGVFH